VQVKVKLFATLRKYLPEAGSSGAGTVELPEGATIRELVKKLEIPEPLARLVMVDGQHVPDLDQKLEDGQTVSIFPPVAGGSKPS
jgi:molybdopterin synthase sulfur carrier subunit